MIVQINHHLASNWPAWVQAIGSVFAVFLAIAVPVLSGHIAKIRHRQAALVLGEQVVKAIENAARQADIDVGHAGEMFDNFELLNSSINTQMEQFPVAKLGNAKAINTFLRLVGTSKNAVTVSIQIQEGRGSKEQLKNMTVASSKRLRELQDSIGSRKCLLPAWIVRRF